MLFSRAVASLTAACSLFSTAAAVAQTGNAAPAKKPPYDAGKLLVSLTVPFLDEASGIAVSRRNPGIIYLHNDSGDGAYLYAVDRPGKTRGVFMVRSASASDWEGMSWGPGPNGRGNFLYIGDIGDNGKNRADCAVYRITEPKIGTTVGSKQNPRLTDEPTIRRQFVYPDGPQNAETLLVHPKTGVIYIVTKDESGASGVYKFPPETENWWEKNTLIKVGTITFGEEPHPYPKLATGGDISPDGRKVILRTYFGAYEWRLPAGAADFDAIWRSSPTFVPTPLMLQSEAICYTPDGKAILTTSEKFPAPVFELRSRDAVPAPVRRAVTTTPKKKTTPAPVKRANDNRKPAAAPRASPQPR